MTGCPDETSNGGAGGTTSATAATGTGCTIPFQGNAELDPVIEVFVNGPGGVDTPVGPGGELPLMFPPQGGRVAFVGVRATNVDPCGVVLTGALRDKRTNQTRFEARTVNLRPTGDGHAASTAGDISTYANLPLCPNQWSDTDLFASTYTLEVEMKDRRGKRATASFDVMPKCAEEDRLVECLCLCDADYVLGMPCEGGTTTSSSASSSTASSSGSGQ